jgi:hypothetical protein
MIKRGWNPLAKFYIQKRFHFFRFAVVVSEAELVEELSAGRFHALTMVSFAIIIE